MLHAREDRLCVEEHPRNATAIESQWQEIVIYYLIADANLNAFTTNRLGYGEEVTQPTQRQPGDTHCHATLRKIPIFFTAFMCS